MASRIPLDRCWILSGATASGKTELGLLLAERLDGEILSLDSMSVYRLMDIGTAKPDAQQRGRVPHHLIDLVWPDEPYSLARYLDDAEAAVRDVLSRGKTPIFVGGTPLYLKALLRGIFEGPPADPALREALRKEAESHLPGRLHAELAKVDPESAARLHPNDTKRLIRALEVYRLTGRPISELQREFDRPVPARECRVFVLDWDRDELAERIARRVNRMFAEGLVEEVARIQAGPHPLGPTASQAIGYREVLDHLAGSFDLDRCRELTIRHTRQFAKRQRTWFRSLSECRFVPVSADTDWTALAQEIAAGGERFLAEDA
ncbi:MAG: tRNA (adenosine(37)-N6)-dimethylallyltransferase MiaA [Planctomycetota bacterium]|nr:MAG: tRNA (adenosine(37)-N6)-dimethylallyltransferase MiaA [Planctomycetota bacterium]